MFESTALYQETLKADALVHSLHGLVTYGPWDLDVASAMSAYGYDEVKWAEGQGLLAELVSSDEPGQSRLAAALAWYQEAAAAAVRTLSAHPQLLAKLGLLSEAA
jgi:hypothetical protein